MNVAAEGAHVPPVSSQNSRSLSGRRVLVVEDDFFQARDAVDYLEQAGAQVLGPACDAADAFVLLEEEEVDAALLDINLGRGPDFAIAEKLRERRVPFLFLTGYAETAIPDTFASVPCLEKPAPTHRVVEALAKLDPPVA